MIRRSFDTNVFRHLPTFKPIVADPEVLKLAEVMDEKEGVTHLVALWDDKTITECSKRVADGPEEAECETMSYQDSRDPARVFYGRLQIDIGLGHKVKVLHDPEAINFIPDIEKFEEIK